MFFMWTASTDDELDCSRGNLMYSVITLLKSFDTQPPLDVNNGHFTEVNFALRVNRNLAVEHNALSSKKL